MDDQRITLTAEEAAEWLGMPYSSLLELVRKKKVPCIRVNRRVFFRRDTLATWLAQCEVESLSNPTQGTLSTWRMRV